MRRICAAAVVAGMTILLTLSAWKNHTYLSKTEVEPEYVSVSYTHLTLPTTVPV